MKNLHKKIMDGLTAKLNFDYSCNRGHAFGEYYAHGVVNEIISSNIDPTNYRLDTGYPHPAIQLNRKKGRPKEIDFVIKNLRNSTDTLVSEVKWAGSSHCTPENILLDLCRLQIIKNSNKACECLMIVSGERNKINELFKKKFLQIGNGSLLHYPLKENMHIGSKVRIKTFHLLSPIHYVREIDQFYINYIPSLPQIPPVIKTSFSQPHGISHRYSRFSTLVWKVE